MGKEALPKQRTGRVASVFSLCALNLRASWRIIVCSAIWVRECSIRNANDV